MATLSLFLTTAFATIIASLGVMFAAVIATKGDQYVGYIWDYLLAVVVIVVLGAIVLIRLARYTKEGALPAPPA